MESRTSTFIDNYNKSFNEFASQIATNYFKRVQVDMELVQSESTGILKSKIRQIDNIINDRNSGENDYAKVKSISLILLDITKDLLSETQAEVRKSGTNILNGFFDVARRTEDNELLKTAMAIKALSNTVIQKKKEAGTVVVL